jgi:hypothetical protein
MRNHIGIRNLTKPQLEYAIARLIFILDGDTVVVKFPSKEQAVEQASLLRQRLIFRLSLRYSPRQLKKEIVHLSWGSLKREWQANKNSRP